MNTDTTPSKPWYLSKTIIGAVATALLALMGLFKIDVTGLEPQLTEALTALGVIITTAITIIGRITARKSLR